MRRQLPWTLLLLLALCVTSCGPLRSSSRGDGRGGDDDDDSADDDDDAVSDDDDDAVSDDDDDVSDDDDDASDDDDDATDPTDDDDASEPLGSISGTWILAYDFGSTFEEKGFVDCDLGRSVDDQGFSPPSGCPSCSYEWTVDLLYSSSNTDCDLAYFGGSPPADLTNVGMGLNGNTYYEHYNGSWYEGMTGTWGGSSSSGYFYGNSDALPSTDGGDYTVTIYVDIEWN